MAEEVKNIGEKEVVSRNFIEMIIDKDLEEGKHTQIMTRFPPEPNGYLHIGHAKSILLNYGLAQKYGGKFNLRFDDTNPTKEKTEFVESIIADVKWLGADFEDRLFFASDYFDQMYEAAVKLIKKGKAYVSDLTAEEIREYRGTLTEGDLLWALKNMCYMDMRQAEAHRIMTISRSKDYIPVRVTTNMYDLVDRAKSQNFVPVVDDKDAFIGIVPRSAIIKYCQQKLFSED